MCCMVQLKHKKKISNKWSQVLYMLKNELEQVFNKVIISLIINHYGLFLPSRYKAVKDNCFKFVLACNLLHRKFLIIFPWLIQNSTTLYVIMMCKIFSKRNRISTLKSACKILAITLSYISKDGFEAPVQGGTTKHFRFLEILYNDCILYLSTWTNEQTFILLREFHIIGGGHCCLL